MEVIIQKDYRQMSKVAGQIVVETLNAKPNSVLGMATGSTPLGLYQELVCLHREEQLDFSRVTTFNLDEYVGLSVNHPQSTTTSCTRTFSSTSTFHRTTSTCLPAPRTTTAPSAHGTSSGLANAAE